MTADYYSALWVSYSAIADFQRCPRLYYLKHIYRNPESDQKIKLISPPLTLGQAVHETIDTIANLPKEERFNESLVVKFDDLWQENYSGKRGGFWNETVEQKHKKRGREMLERVTKNPGPLANLAVKIQDDDIPRFWLSKEEEIVLCGKLDWLEYLPETDGVHIIDFKTGRRMNDGGSLQLPIYYLLASNVQDRPVEKTSYWYLAQHDRPRAVELPELAEARQAVLKEAKKIKLARKMEQFSCPEDGCRWCQPYERIIAGEGERVGTGSYGADLFILPPKEKSKESKIL